MGKIMCNENDFPEALNVHAKAVSTMKIQIQEFNPINNILALLLRLLAKIQYNMNTGS